MADLAHETSPVDASLTEKLNAGTSIAIELSARNIKNGVCPFSKVTRILR